MGKTPDRITADNVKNMAGDASTKVLSKEELELPYECNICKKRFKSIQGRNGHMLSHRVESIEVTVNDVTEEGKEEDPLAWVKMYMKGRVVHEGTIRKLAAQEKVTFIIPEDPYESKLNYYLAINGNVFEYPVGQYLVIPRDIVTQIRNVYKESELAKRRNLVDRNAEVERALSK